MPKIKDEGEKDTAAKIFETLRSSQFLKSLYWDVLSDLREKPTFKDMRERLKKVLNDKLDALETLSVNTSKFDSDVEKSIVSEICSLAFTVDTIYSKILFLKLENEFNSQILNIINELRSEGEIPDDVWAELDIPNTNLNKNIKGANNSAKQNTESPIESEQVTKKGKQMITLNEDKELENKKHTSKNNREKSDNLPQSKMETRSHAVPKKTASPVATYTCKTQSPEKSNSNISKEIKAEIDLVNSFLNERQDSDTDSVISVGHVSLASVSSVHTSDLSSFDDEVSVSSDDEGTRRRVSLKDLVDHTDDGNLNGLKKKTPKSKGSHHNNVHENATPQASVQPTDEAIKSSTSELLSPSHSSKRVRKPNSKYSSDTIICQAVKVKERKKSDVSTVITDEMSSERSPKRKRTSDTEVETSIKVQKVNENKSSNDKKTPKEKLSVDLLKPVSIVRPLTSRKTAPLTLFSSKP